MNSSVFSKLKSKKTLFLVLIFIIAFVLRFIIYYYTLAKTAQTGLTGGYIAEADNILQGNQWFYSTMANGSWALNTVHPKGYTMLIVLLKILFNDNWLFVMHIIQAAVDSTAAVLVFYLTDHMFHDSRIDYTASILYAFCPLVNLNSVQEVPDSFTCFLIVLILFVYYKEYKKGYQRYLYLGLVAGIANYFRSELVYVLIVLLFCDWTWKRGLKKALIHCALSISVVLAVCSPWLIYAYQNSGHFILGATSSWGSAYEALGENPDNSWGIVLSDLQLTADAAEVGLEGPFQYDGNQYYKKKFIEAVTEHPEEYISTILNYRLVKAFIPGTYAMFNLNQTYDNITQDTFCSAAECSGSWMCDKLYDGVKIIEARLAKLICTIYFISMLIFIFLKRKEWKKYSAFILSWLFFPCAIALLKQIEPRNVASDLPIEIIALSFILVKAIGVIRMRIGQKRNPLETV